MDVAVTRATRTYQMISGPPDPTPHAMPDTIESDEDKAHNEDTTTHAPRAHLPDLTGQQQAGRQASHRAGQASHPRHRCPLEVSAAAPPLVSHPSENAGRASRPGSHRRRVAAAAAATAPATRAAAVCQSPRETMINMEAAGVIGGTCCVTWPPSCIASAVRGGCGAGSPSSARWRLCQLGGGLRLCEVVDRRGAQARPRPQHGIEQSRDTDQASGQRSVGAKAGGG